LKNIAENSWRIKAQFGLSAHRRTDAKDAPESTQPASTSDCFEVGFCVFSTIMSFESFFTLVVLLFLACYASVTVYALRGLNLLSKRPERRTEPRPRFSVIVAARNEEGTIGRCLDSLLLQQYPSEDFEIIVANDRSTDRSGEVIESYRRRAANLRVIAITEEPHDLPPKKNALDRAIRMSNHEFLAFTDADCSPPPTWLAAIADQYDQEVGVVAGYSPIGDPEPTGIARRAAFLFLRYLEVKNSIGAAAGIGLEHPYMCTGRNFSYRKRVFMEVGGFEKIKHSISGDDDLFLQLVERETRWKVRYMTSQQSFVPTNAPSTLREFVNQRRRHFSAGKFYPVSMKLLFGLVHGFGVLSILAVIVYPSFGLAILAAKLAFDALIVAKGTSLFGEQRLFPSIVVLEIASVLYNALIGPLGVLGKFTWKGARS